MYNMTSLSTAELKIHTIITIASHPYIRPSVSEPTSDATSHCGTMVNSVRELLPADFAGGGASTCAPASSSLTGGELNNALPALTTPRMPWAASRPLIHWTSVMPGTRPSRSYTMC